MKQHSGRSWSSLILCLALVFTILRPSEATTAQYTYDAMGRLLKVDYGAGRSIDYTYDANGNLLTRAALNDIAQGDVNVDGKVDLTDAILTLRVVTRHDMATEDITTYMTSGKSVDSPLGLVEALFILQDIASLR